MTSFNLLSIVFGLFSLAYLCEGSLKENFCTDLSFWDVITYSSSSAMCCDTVLKKDCITKTERVCADATEIKCNTVGWAECATKVSSAEGKKCDVSYKDFPYKDCKEDKYSVKHKKQVPKCKTVTKDNCFPDWRTGQEKCSPISWEECELVEKDVDFPTVKTNCETVGNIKWADFLQKTTEIVEMKQSCEVKSTVNCVPVVVNNCMEVQYTECEMRGQESCNSQPVHAPGQEYIHQKKCF